MATRISSALLTIAFISLSNFASAQFQLSLNCSEMDPHIGQRFEVRITDMTTAAEVAREVLDEIPSADFTMDFVCLRQGRSYFVDFFADVNQNGSYDAPPVDHVWRETLNEVTSDEEINFVHDTMFTDVGWPGMSFLSYFEAVWGGKWQNLTFGSTDSIEVDLLLVCDSFFVHFETKGLFGNPATVTFDMGIELTNQLGDFITDTVSFVVDTPLMGELILINGRITGDFVHPVTGIGLQFQGNFAGAQVMALYTVTDANGVVFANGYFYVLSLDVVDARSEVRLSLVSSDSASCSGIADGSATVDGSGGFQPYTFLWSDGGMGPVRDDLAAGMYTVSLTDQNGCEDTLTVIINASDHLTIQNTALLNVSCAGAMDGQVEVAGMGGTPPYAYVWDDGRTNALHDLLSSGPHSVTITDANGCQSDTMLIVDEPDPLVLDSVMTVDSKENNGEINIVVTGGTLPYSFEWTKDNAFFSNDQNLSNLAAGAYIVAITDANGCQLVSDTILIDNITATSEIQQHFEIYPNPAGTFLNIDADFEWYLELLDLTGNKIAHFASSAQGDKLSLAGIDSGMYFLVLYKGDQMSVLKLVIQLR